MNELYANVHEMVSNAFGLLSGLPGWPERVITDEDARIGRRLMDALLLLEGEPHALDEELVAELDTEWTEVRARRIRVRWAQEAVAHGHLIQAYTFLTEWREEEKDRDESRFTPEDAYALVALQSGANCYDSGWEAGDSR